MRANGPSMDIVYIFQHSPQDDFEIRQSLRSVARFAPWIRKVWIFGDRPAFISGDKSLIEHVPHEMTARVLDLHGTPHNFFLLMFLASLIPDLSFEYLQFCDDIVLLKDFPESEARKERYLENLAHVHTRGRGLWKDSLWRTYDLLTRLDYPGFNFETHVPHFLTRKRVLDAFCQFKDFVTEDPHFGIVGPSAVLNHAYRAEKFDLVCVGEEKSRAGFWGKPPGSVQEIVSQAKGRMFFNFDDQAFNDCVRKFLQDLFPTASKFERAPDDSPAHASI